VAQLGDQRPEPEPAADRLDAKAGLGRDLLDGRSLAVRPSQTDDGLDRFELARR
jgi:hypothetical protein